MSKSKRKSVPAAATESAPLRKEWNDTRGAGRKTKKTLSAAATSAVPIDDEPFTWDASIVDHEFAGEWDWSLEPKEAKDVLDLLANMSKLTWRNVKGLKTNSRRRTRALHHSQPVHSIHTDAQRRLETIGRGDQEEVFRLRHGNLLRLWGVVEGSRFYILWFDRNHKICPRDD